MKIEVRISGFGGQGVVLAGQILGKAAVYSGKKVAQTQTYGAEARGSAAKSEIIISETQIGYPMVRKCDILVAMNQDAVERNIKDLKQNGVLLVDSSSVATIAETNANIVKVAATQTAEDLFKDKIYANMIILGALTKITNIVSQEAVERAIKASFPRNTIETNIQAFIEGRNLVE